MSHTKSKKVIYLLSSSDSSSSSSSSSDSSSDSSSSDDDEPLVKSKPKPKPKPKPKQKVSKALSFPNDRILSLIIRKLQRIKHPKIDEYALKLTNMIIESAKTNDAKRREELKNVLLVLSDTKNMKESAAKLYKRAIFPEHFFKPMDLREKMPPEVKNGEKCPTCKHNSGVIVPVSSTRMGTHKTGSEMIMCTRNSGCKMWNL